MQLIPIFVDETSGEGLYSAHYKEEDEDELTRNLDLWRDPQYVLEYLLSNKECLEVPYFKNSSIDSIALKVESEAIELERLLCHLTKRGFKHTGSNLQELFKPLENNEYSLYIHQQSKAVIDDHHFPRPILRIYALRISSNTYVITGGAIKLTKEMREHDDTVKELDKLTKVKQFLIANELSSEEEIKEFLYEQF
ncbi:MAG: hypothetical protein QM731_28115 [Chitinophagaceae bacterium]